MELTLKLSEMLTVRAEGVNGSLILNNTGVSLHVHGFDHGLMRQLVKYPDCNESHPPRELGPALTEPFSTPPAVATLDSTQLNTLASKLDAAFAKRGPLMLGPHLTAIPITSVGVSLHRETPELDQLLRDFNGPTPDFKAIANELFDMLYTVQLSLTTANDYKGASLFSKSQQVAELLDRVEAAVKDK